MMMMRFRAFRFPTVSSTNKRSVVLSASTATTATTTTTTRVVESAVTSTTTTTTNAYHSSSSSSLLSSTSSSSTSSFSSSFSLSSSSSSSSSSSLLFSTKTKTHAFHHHQQQQQQQQQQQPHSASTIGYYLSSSSSSIRSFTSSSSESSADSSSSSSSSSSPSESKSESFESFESLSLYPDIRSYDKQYINGKWVDSTNNINSDTTTTTTTTTTGDNERSRDSTINVIDSNTGNIVATVPNGTKYDTINAINAANNALIKWRNTSLKTRLNYIKTFLDKIELHREEINNRLIIELGCTKTFANNSQLGSLIGHTKTLINLLDEETDDEDDDDDDEEDDDDDDEEDDDDDSKFKWEYSAGKCTVIKESIGVVGCITPWNYPLNQIALKVIPALLAGCTVVLKPSEVTPLCAYSICEALHESKLPNGVFNMIIGDGKECGEILASHTNVNLISFTGSTYAGQILTKVAAQSETMKVIKTELGGKSAALLLDDANFDIVVPEFVKQLTSNTGQSCNALSRMIVPRLHYQKVIELCKKTMNDEIVDDSRINSKATIGPLVSKKQYDSVTGLIQQGIDEGATLLVGGIEKPTDLHDSNINGYFVQPTLFGNVTNNMTIAQTEIFGPVLCLIVYDTLEEGINIVNDTPYGLNNAIASSNIKKALHVASQLQSGMVMVNHTNLDLKAPFGGYKLSGNAREWGESGLDEFLITKMINMDINEYRKNK